MLHPSYTDLINAVNSGVEPGEEPVVQSRYSIVIATAKRARQLIGGEDPMIVTRGKKPLSVAVEELYEISKSWGPTPSTSPRFSRATATATTPGITGRWTAAWEPTRTLPLW